MRDEAKFTGNNNLMTDGLKLNALRGITCGKIQDWVMMLAQEQSYDHIRAYVLKRVLKPKWLSLKRD